MLNNHSAEWLIEAPRHWPRLRLKSSIESVTNGFWGEEPTGDENDVVCVRVADFDYDKLRVSKEKLTLRKILPKDAEHRLLKTGDILLEKSGGGEKQPVGRAVLFTGTERAVSSNFVARLRTKPLVTNSDFLSYYLSALYSLRINLRSINQTTGIQNLDGESFYNEPIALPPLSEQRSIARFLDEKTAKIDTLIEKKRRLIELLKEERQAVINHALTKGMNPNATMKPSGIEWLGDVPEGWEVKKLKYVGWCQNGVSQSAEYFGSGFPFVSYGDVYKNVALPAEIVGLAQATESDKKVYSVEKGDVLFTRTSETIEEIGFSSTCLNSIPNSTFSGFIIRFRPSPKMLFEGFSKYFFRSDLHRRFFVKEMNIVTRASLSQDLLKSLPVLLPALEEQKGIAVFLDSKTNEIDTLISKAERAILLLTEYRTALITEAVTGKIQI